MCVSKISEEKNVPIKENNSLPLTRTLCDSTQPVACIRGYEPSGASNRDSEPLPIDPGYISGKHKDKCDARLPANVIKTV